MVSEQIWDISSLKILKPTMVKYPRSAMTSGTESGTFDVVSNPENPITHSINLPERNIIPINGHKLNGNNFIHFQWSQSVMIFLCGKGKQGYLTGAAIAPEENSLAYRNWKVENHMLMSWLLNSITNEMGENFMYYKTAKEIRHDVYETHSNEHNSSTVLESKGSYMIYDKEICNRLLQPVYPLLATARYA